MELLWREETIEAFAARAKVEVRLEGEVPPPEGRSCSSVLAASCTVEGGSCSCSSEEVRIEGVLLITLLCEDGDELYGYVSRAPFSQVYTESGAEEARAVFTVNSQQLKLENGSLSFSAVLECDMLLTKSLTLRSLRDMSGLEAGALQLREENYSLTRRRPAETLTLQLREEASVSGVSEVLAANGTVFFKTGQEEAPEGTLIFSALCRSADGKMKQVLRQLPLHIDEELNGTVPESCSLRELSVRSVGEEFGILAVEATLKLHSAQIESRVCTLPLDAFAPSFPFDCVYGEHTALRDLGSRAYRHSFDVSLPLPEGLPEIAECVYACAQSVITSAATENDRLYIEGIIDTRAVYRSAGGTRCCFSRETPFTVDFPAPQADTVQLESEAFVLCDGGGSSLQAHYTLCLRASFDQSVALRAVTGIRECEKEKPAPGLVILFAGAGESLFNVAKRYNVTLESLYTLQSELAEPLADGQKLLLLI